MDMGRNYWKPQVWDRQRSRLGLLIPSHKDKKNGSQHLNPQKFKEFGEQSCPEPGKGEVRCQPGGLGVMPNHSQSPPVTLDLELDHLWWWVRAEETQGHGGWLCILLQGPTPWGSGMGS